MITIRNLTKSFDSNRVLDKLNLVVPEGQTTVVIGRSGCGKSVLLKHIIGILKPDSGEILINGRDITKLKEGELNKERKRFGMVFQGGALFDSLTVGENVGFSLREHTNLNEGERREIIRKKLELVGLEGIEDLKPDELSGGMK